MGGSGSGIRYISKKLVESSTRIDFGKLDLQNKFFYKAFSFKNGFGSYDENREITIGPEYFDSPFPFTRLKISLSKFRLKNKEEYFEEIVDVEWVKCHFGGKRPYVICPGSNCGKRVLNLFLSGKKVRCRHCLDLAYETQRVDKLWRLLIKERKAYKKLNLDWRESHELPLPRPKGMHTSTYLKHVQKILNSKLDCMKITQYLECSDDARVSRKKMKKYKEIEKIIDDYLLKKCL